MRRLKRFIEVFEQDMVRVEVEGNTVSVQVVDPKKPQNVWKGVLPRPVAAILTNILSSALALEGGEVVEQGITVVRDRHQPCSKHGYVDCESCDSASGGRDEVSLED